MTKYPFKINLYNRYGSKIYLENVENSTYILKGDTDYVSVICEDEKTKNVVAIDPSGGPFISIGFKPIKNLIVTKIKTDNNNYLVELSYVSE